jgi:hypothetical protein
LGVEYQGKYKEGEPANCYQNENPPGEIPLIRANEPNSLLGSKEWASANEGFFYQSSGGMGVRSNLPTAELEATVLDSGEAAESPDSSQWWTQPIGSHAAKKEYFNCSLPLLPAISS